MEAEGDTVDSGDSEDTLPLALDLGSIRRDENQDVLPVTTAKTLTQKFSVQRGSTVRKVKMILRSTHFCCSMLMMIFLYSMLFILTFNYHAIFDGLICI